MKVVQTKLAPGGKFLAITLFGVVFTRNRKRLDQTVLNHERIHCRQQLELLYIPFFLIYGAEWLWHLVRTRDSFKVYRAISFEREAYAHENDPAYLSRRKFFGTWRR